MQCRSGRSTSPQTRSHHVKPLIFSLTSRLCLETLCVRSHSNGAQTEADPQVISLLLERAGYGDVAEKVINVAGHRCALETIYF
jgi:hypothetical protein